MRVFIGIDLPIWTDDELLLLMDQLKKQKIQGRYVPAANLHMTLVFLGELSDEQIEKTKTILSRLDFRPFLMESLKLDLFKKQLVMTFQNNPELSCLVDNLKDELDEAHIPFDHKTFIPHITLVRGCSLSKEDLPVVPPLSFEGESIHLFFSDLRKTGAVYSSLFSINAKKNDLL